jgi:hypothetical protein
VGKGSRSRCRTDKAGVFLENSYAANRGWRKFADLCFHLCRLLVIVRSPLFKFKQAEFEKQARFARFGLTLMP